MEILNVSGGRGASGAAAPVASKYLGAADLAPGFMVATEFGSVGGAETETASEDTGDGSMIRKRIRYDHPALHKGAQAVINQGYKIMREYGSPMFAGLYFVAEKDFDALDGALQELRDAADILNEEAGHRRSNRETKIEIYPFEVERSSPRLALRVGRVIYEYLVRLRETFDAEAKNAFVMEWRMAKNLDKVLVGEQASIVRAALRSAEDQRPVMIARYGGRRGVKQVLHDGGGKIPELDYTAIDKAIALFAPARGLI